MTTVHEILTAAKALSAAERAELMAALWDNVSPDDWSPPSAEWIAEANRRSDAFDEGKFSGTPWSEVRERVRLGTGC